MFGLYIHTLPPLSLYYLFDSLKIMGDDHEVRMSPQWY